MASLRRLARLEVVFTAWPTVNCKQLEVVLPPLLFPSNHQPVPSARIVRPTTNGKFEAHWIRLLRKQKFRNLSDTLHSSYIVMEHEKI